MSHNFLTIHSLTALPWHNLNRDDRGLPKQVTEGGVTKGVLSAQSQKRAIRNRYEAAAEGLGSYRSKSGAEEAVRRAGELAEAQGVEFDAVESLKRAKKAIAALVKKEAKPDKDGNIADAKDTVVWLGADELDTLAQALVSGVEDPAIADFIGERVGSLAIAAFGRMFAAAQEFQNEAAIAVGTAVTTHPITVEIDYFTAVDDLSSQGSAHLDQAFYTTGVYYRSLTIDKRQLRNSWSGWDAPDADERLTELVRSLVLALPNGKNTSTAAKVSPAVVIAELQSHRTNYQWQRPVRATVDGGYLTPSIEGLFDKVSAARKFDPEQFGEVFVTGETFFEADAPTPEFAHTTGTLAELAATVTEWLRA
jgi:CRISPR system Cascade subunit CasC